MERDFELTAEQAFAVVTEGATEDDGELIPVGMMTDQDQLRAFFEVLRKWGEEHPPTKP